MSKKAKLTLAGLIAAVAFGGLAPVAAANPPEGGLGRDLNRIVNRDANRIVNRDVDRIVDDVAEALRDVGPLVRDIVNPR